MAENEGNKPPDELKAGASGKGSGSSSNPPDAIIPKRLIGFALGKPTPFPGLRVFINSLQEPLVQELKKRRFFVIASFVEGETELDLSKICALGVLTGAPIKTEADSLWNVPVQFILRVHVSDVKGLEFGDVKPFECSWKAVLDVGISPQMWEAPEFQEMLYLFRETLMAISGLGVYAIQEKLKYLDKLVPTEKTRERERVFLDELEKDFKILEEQAQNIDRNGLGLLVDQAAMNFGTLVKRVLLRDDITNNPLFWAKSREIFRSVGIFERVNCFMDFAKFALGLVEDGQRLALREKNEILADSFPDYVRERIEKESERANPHTADGNVVIAYIDWLRDLPWMQETIDETDLLKIEKSLEEDHCGLEAVKGEILEFIAVRKARPDAKSPILCIVGPPGVGKTSLGKSIAGAMGRKFVRRSLGGVHDEAELRGHRRTYVGALPGMIIQEMRNLKVRNPVFMLDEVDKIGHDFRGDPAAALLEILDPEQNNTFKDHYIDLPFDLSKVFFIATANTTLTIPEALLDRMKIIEIPPYTEEEKKEIAVRHTVPKALREYGIDADNLRQKGISVFGAEFEGEAMADIIWEYAHDAGMRDTERTIKTVLGKILKIVEQGRLAELDPDGSFVRITRDKLRFLLGEPKTHAWHPDLDSLPAGVAAVLMVNHNGQGLIGFVEVSVRNSDDFNRKITGHLQEVMEQSVEVAISRLFRNGGPLEGMWPKKFLHIHFTDGAVPKDGPSAGLMAYAAIYSAFKDLPIKPYFAVTGEINLKRFVAAPVGGITAKLLAAKRAGIREVAIPLANRKDIKKMPEGVRIITPSDLGDKSWRGVSLEDKPEGSFTIYCVEKPEDVLELAFPKHYSPCLREREKENTE